MSRSGLVDYVKLSPNHSGRRSRAIDTVSIHCMAGNLSVEACGALFARSSTGASSNYGIGSDGRVGLYVEEENRSWCTSSASNDDRAVTIEVANCGGADEGWPVTEAACGALIGLLADICQRNGMEKLVWSWDKEERLGHRNGCNMTVHRDFAQKSCPGDWLYNRHGEIAAEVNRRLAAGQEEDEDMDVARFAELMGEYRKTLQDNDAGAWSQEDRAWAVAHGLISGMGKNEKGEVNYAWADFLTREQAAALFHRLAKLLGQG